MLILVWKDHYMKLNYGWFISGLILAMSTFGCSDTGKSTARKIAFQERPAGTVQVMSFNIRYGTADDGPNSWPFRKEAVFDLLADSQADVIGLQEVLEAQLEEIRKAVPQYASVSTGRDDGMTAGEACSILYRKDRFELADSGTFWFSNTPWLAGTKHWGNGIPRICTWVRLIEKTNGKAFYMYNVHLDHQSQPSREKSVRLLAKVIANRGTDEPYLVTGDFNMSMNNPAMLYLQKIGFESPYPRLTDVWQLVFPETPAGGTFHGFTGEAEADKIDHILVTENTSVLNAEIDTQPKDGRYPSDHYPFKATIRLYE
jgi:endonuclease/exonuclease/phosphatase family metal-dependent hydrolase